MSEEYEANARWQQERANAAFGVFLETLPQETRWKLLDLPPKSKGDVGLEGDVAESPAASYSADFVDDIDDLADELAEQFRFNQKLAAGVALFAERYLQQNSEKYNDWLICKVIMRLTSAENCKVAAVAMAFALSVPQVWVNGRLHATQISAAKALGGMTRSNLSKAVCSAKEYLGIEHGMHLKPPEAVAAFSVAGVKDHWRRRVYRGRKHGK